METNGENKEPRKNIQGLTLGLNMAAGMAFFTYIGYRIDQARGGHLWTLVGMFLGLLYCGFEVWKLVREGNKEEALRDRGKSNYT